MDNILNLIICCKSDEIHKKSEINVNTDNSTSNIHSAINNKIEEKDKSEKSFDVKNESSNIKSLDNIINENVSEIVIIIVKSRNQKEKDQIAQKTIKKIKKAVKKIDLEKIVKKINQIKNQKIKIIIAIIKM